MNKGKVVELETFDPTKAKPGDRERFQRFKWLPDLADEAKAKKQIVLSKKNVASHIRDLPAIKQEKRTNLKSEMFPKHELVNSDLAKRRLRINPKAGFLSELRTSALLRAKNEEIDQQKRRLEVISSYDWNLVKQIGEPFAKYIEILMEKGKILSASDEWDSLTVKGSRKLSNERKSENEDLKNVVLNQNEDQQLIETLKHILLISPFRVKPKGKQARPKFFNDLNHLTWSFGRPEQLKDQGEDFGRIFSEIEDFGSTVKAKSNIVNFDAELFKIAYSKGSMGETVGNSQNESDRNSKKSTPLNSKKNNRQTFEEQRTSLHNGLIKYLKDRDIQKYQNSLDLQKMIKVETCTMNAAKKFIASEKIISLRRVVPTQNLWQAPKSPNAFDTAKIDRNLIL